MTFHTAADYTPEQTELIRSATLTAATILGDYMDDLAVVGGLVPSLLIPQAELPAGADPHVGTMDLDLGLDLAGRSVWGISRLGTNPPTTARSSM